VLGAWFLIEAYLLGRRARVAATPEQAGAMRLFHISITYLTLLFIAVGLDPFLRF
jgi:protoheme IX farnesyltransferase